MTLNNRVYDTLKYLAQVGLPALATLVFALGPIWDLTMADEITKTIIAFNVFLGALLVLNQVKYNNSDAKYDGVIDPVTANTQTSDNALNLSTDEYDAANQKEVLLKVVQHDPVI